MLLIAIVLQAIAGNSDAMNGKIFEEDMTKEALKAGRTFSLTQNSHNARTPAI